MAEAEEEFEDDFEEDESPPSSPDSKARRKKALTPKSDGEEEFEDDFEEDDPASPGSESKTFDDTFEADDGPESPSSPTSPDSRAAVTPAADATVSPGSASAESPVLPASAADTPASPAGQAVAGEQDSAVSASPGAASSPSPAADAPELESPGRKLQFEEPAEEQELPTSVRGDKRKPTGFVKTDGLPLEDDDDEDGRKLRFTEPEADPDQSALKQERSAKRKGTEFLKPSDLPCADDIDATEDVDDERKLRFEEPEADPGVKRERSMQRKGTKFLQSNDVPGEDDFDEAKDGETERALRFEEPVADPDQPGEKRERSIQRKGTTFLKPSDVPGEDDVDATDEGGERQIRFDEADDSSGKLKRTRRDNRKGTGFVRPTDLPSEGGEDDDCTLRFEEPEDKHGRGHLSFGRKPAGGVQKDDSLAKDSERKPRFEAQEEDAASTPSRRERKMKRQPTGFVNRPSEEDLDEESNQQLRFEEPQADGGESRRSPKRRPTGFVKPSALDYEDEDDEANQDDVSELMMRTEKALLYSPLNPGEEGEDEDPDDDELFQSCSTLQRSQQKAFITKSSSAPTLAGSLAVARRKIPSHLAAPKRKVPPRRKPLPLQAWDERHQLCGVENELLPKPLRAYFSRPQNIGELKDDLNLRNNMTSMLKRIDLEEVPPTRPTPITSDSGPPVIPTKHEAGGTMRGVDNDVRPWNNRWSQGIGNLNEGLHPLHREYFTAQSLFADAPSQRWRRYCDIDMGKGVWKPIKQGNAPRFPPLGV